MNPFLLKWEEMEADEKTSINNDVTSEPVVFLSFNLSVSTDEDNLNLENFLRERKWSGIPLRCSQKAT